MKLSPVCSTEYPDDVRFCPNDGQTLRASSPAHDLVGQVVADRYHVLKKLGEGGMGQVYLAEHVKMGRNSAIKVMSPSMVHDPDAVARFNREAANASRITHSTVCAIYDFGETPEGLIYLAMEFIEGEPLTDLLDRAAALPVGRAVSIFGQVADALQAAHDLGIVHRDLKPDNIMLTRSRDGSDVVNVVDFGIAKAVGSDDSQRVTKTGLVVGTPEFMSPEQLSGDKLDGRSDIYSLALVLFKMLTGKLPFQASTVQETMIKRLTDDPVTLVDARPDLRVPARAPGDTRRGARAHSARPLPVRGQVRHGRGSGGRRAARWRAALAPGDPRGHRPADPAARRPTERGREAVRPAAAPSGPRKKRSAVPIVVGAVVVLAGAGAAVTLLGGGDKRGDTARPDTARPGAVASGRERARPGSRSVPLQPRPQTSGAGSAGGRIAGFDPARAGPLLDRLLEQGAPMAVIVNSARLVYTTPAVAVKDRAFAACLLAQTYNTASQDSLAQAWARQGLALDPTLQSCLQVVQSAGGR